MSQVIDSNFFKEESYLFLQNKQLKSAQSQT